MNGTSDEAPLREVRPSRRELRTHQEKSYEPPPLIEGVTYSICYKGNKYEVKIKGRILPSESPDRKEWIIIIIPAGMHSIKKLTEMTVQRQVFIEYLKEAEQLR